MVTQNVNPSTWKAEARKRSSWVEVIQIYIVSSRTARIKQTNKQSRAMEERKMHVRSMFQTVRSFLFETVSLCKP